MSAATDRSSVPAVLVERVEKSFLRRASAPELLRRPFARRGRIQALSQVSFTVEPGRFVGLLGPNGAGKTTLLKILCGLVLPDAGRVEILGVPVGSPAVPRVLGLVHGDERSFYWRLTCRENLEFFARLHNVPSARRRERVDELLGRAGLRADADRRFSDFSSGMRQRLAIVRALLADPPVLLMDEPTRSLDPVSAARQREWIRTELHQRMGKTILMATHNLREAETLCERIVVVVHGAVRADGPPEELRRRGAAGVVYRLRVRGPAPASLAGAALLSRREEADGSCDLLVRLERDEALDRVVDEVRALGARLVSCAPEAPDLEHVFRQLVETSGGQGTT